MTKTLVDIPDELMEAAREALGPGASKAETVRTALAEFVRRRRQAATIDWFTGTDIIADLRDPAVREAARR